MFEYEKVRIENLIRVAVFALYHVLSVITLPAATVETINLKLSQVMIGRTEPLDIPARDSVSHAAVIAANQVIELRERADFEQQRIENILTACWNAVDRVDPAKREDEVRWQQVKCDPLVDTCFDAHRDLIVIPGWPIVSFHNQPAH